VCDVICEGSRSGHSTISYLFVEKVNLILVIKPLRIDYGGESLDAMLSFSYIIWCIFHKACSYKVIFKTKNSQKCYF